VIQSSQDGANFNEEFLTDLSTFTLQSVNKHPGNTEEIVGDIDSRRKRWTG